MKRKPLTWLVCLALLACVALASSAGAASLVNEDSILSASNGLVGEDFGIWTDIDGNRAIVGARFADDPVFPGNQMGAAYIYDYNGSAWAQSAQLAPAYGDWNGHIGEHVAVFGDIAVVGAPYQTYNTPGTNAGAAWVFQYEGGSWVEKQMLTASDGAADDHFGSVAFDGQTIVVSATLADVDSVSNVGAAYVFKNVGGTWTQTQKLSMATPVADSRMGYVAVDGNTIVGGAYYGSAAYVFEYDEFTTSWSQTAQLAGNGGNFGRSVDVKGDTIAVGADNANEGYIFERNQGGAGAWGQVAQLTGSRAGGFGQSAAIIDANTVAFSGDTVNLPPGQSNEGAAFVFRKDSGTGQWAETNMLAASSPTSGDTLGNCIAASGNRLLAGAMYGDGIAANTGTAYVFTVPATGTPIPPATPDPPEPGPGGPVVPGGSLPYAWYRTDVAGVIVTTDDPYYPGSPQTHYLADRTTNGRYLSVMTGSPEVTANAPNGKTTLTFNGEDVMGSLPEDFGHAPSGTIFAVWHATDYAPRHTYGVTYVYDGWNADPLQREFLSYNFGTTAEPDVPKVSAGSGPIPGTNPAQWATGSADYDVLDQWVVTAISYADGDGAEDFIRINGAQIFTGDLDAGTGLNGLVLGATYKFPTFDYNLRGDFAELIIFEGELTATEIQAIEAALMARWFQDVQIPGDATGEGTVDELDARRLAENWGATTLNPAYDTWWEMGDFNNDEVVNAADASILAANWGYGTGEATATPEPSALGALLVGALAWAFCRGRR